MRIAASIAFLATIGGHHLLIEASEVCGRPVSRDHSAR